MTPTRIAKLRRRVDEVLESGTLDEAAQQALIGVLTPDTHEQTWPAVEVVLHVAEHPVVAGPMREQKLPEGLQTALVQAFSAVLPLLGTRAFGPLYKFAERARRKLDLERRKYEIVVERLQDEPDEDDALRLLRNYLGTDPAPLFVARLRQRHGRLVGEAEDQLDIGAEFDLLTEDAALVEALLNPASAEVDDVRARLGELADSPDVTAPMLRRALAADDAEKQLIAAALAVHQVRTDLAPPILGLVLAGAPHAAHLAVLAARLAPLMARNVFSQFLAEVAWQNPEEPEAELTAGRTHAILAARCVLPHIGSPLEAVGDEHVPESLADDDLEAVPAYVEACWALWEAV